MAAIMRYRIAFAAGAALGYVLGTKAGRERYEQLAKYARQVSHNPAVRNVTETATQQGRVAAGKAVHVVSVKVGDRLPDSVSRRVRAFSGNNHGDDFGSGTV
ncbi:secreted protein [Streptomyces sp. SPB78]|nr:secreted protein [Streptomyces sp. SPB78]